MYPPDCIFLFDDVFTTDECKYLIEMIDKYAIKGSEVYGTGRNVIADSVNVLEISDIKDQKKVKDLTVERVIKLIEIFEKKYHIHIGGFSSPSLRKIKGTTRLHVDEVLLQEKISNGVVPASELRNMAVVVALNGDYDGGEFYFPAQGRTIKLKRGQMIAFPPYWTHPHGTKALEGGTVRYTINLWTYQDIPT